MVVGITKRLQPRFVTHYTFAGVPMNQEKQKKFLLAIAYYGIILVGAIIGIRYLFSPLLPFLCGFLIAWLLRRPARYLSEKCRLPYKLFAAILTAVFYILIIGLLFLAGTQLFSAMKELFQMLPELFSNQLLPLTDRLINTVEDFFGQFDRSVAAQMDSWFLELSSTLMQMITSLSSSALKYISGVAAKTPTMILRVVLTVISTFYFSFDFERIKAFICHILPKKLTNAVMPLKDKAVSSLKIFVRSYCLIFLLTSAELVLGFLILRVPYPAVLGVLVAFIDLMPILGTGLILLPWALISAITGKLLFAFGILMLYIVITIIRNIVEPKLVGKQIGLHPLATLISMFVGLQLFGIIGMFILPVTLSIIVQLRRDGILSAPSWMKE